MRSKILFSKDDICAHVELKMDHESGENEK